MRAVKTRKVTSWILYAEMECVEQQGHEQMLEEGDRDKLLHHLNGSMTAAQHSWTVVVDEPSMKNVLNSVAWYHRLSTESRARVRDIIEYQVR